MAVTQDEERAAKISAEFVIDIRDKIEDLYAGKYNKFRTRSLFKNRGGILDSTYYEISPPVGHPVTERVNRKDSLYITRVTNGQKYVSKLTGTATKSPGDRLFTDLKRRLTKDLRNAWCENQQNAFNVSKESLKKPMLLSKWEKQKKKIAYPCYVQPKHDGIRAMYDGNNCKLYSRSGKVVMLPHITNALKAFGACSLDGEICFDDFTVPLPEVMEAISRQDQDLKFMVFDNLGMHQLTFEERFINRVKGWFEPGGLASIDNIRITDTLLMDDESQIDEYYERATQAGMEGVVIRNVDSPYQFGKRTMFTLKYKLEYEEKFLVEGYQRIPHPEGDLIQFVCTFNGKHFEVVPAWKHRERRECLRALDGDAPLREPNVTYMIPNLPSMLIEYRGITPDGKPYHAVGKTNWKTFKKELSKI
jgi:ATP-dependent DNA ligase